MSTLLTVFLSQNECQAEKMEGGREAGSETHCSGAWNNRRPLASTSGQPEPLTKDTQRTHNEALQREGRLWRVQFPTQLALF